MGWVVGCSLGGESWDGEEEGEIEEERVGKVGIYWLLPMESPMENHRWNVSIGDSIGTSADECATSLYGDPDLNPSIILSVKSPEKNQRHHTVATFQKSI